MILFPSAKINLGLNVLRARTDGYHDIESILVPIPLRDVLEAMVMPSGKPNELIFTRTGIPIPGDPEQDLCVKAVRLLQREKELPGLRMHLHKVIPIGAGLGGGSSDGAHTLLLLNNLLQLDLGEERLLALATELGSDCPFFLHHRAQLAEGRGERLSPVDLSLKGYWLMLVNPGVHVSTAEVYANTKPTGVSASWISTVTSTPPKIWRDQVVNVMEDHVFRVHPEIADIKRDLLASGAEYAAMSGSGSSVFGLFSTEPSRINFPQKYRSWILRM